jgi:hypothetical protein
MPIMLASRLCCDAAVLGLDEVFCESEDNITKLLLDL